MGKGGGRGGGGNYVIAVDVHLGVGERGVKGTGRGEEEGKKGGQER